MGMHLKNAWALGARVSPATKTKRGSALGALFFIWIPLVFPIGSS
jgi:hypothetical protein